jgi:hypothetical protein
MLAVVAHDSLEPNLDAKGIQFLGEIKRVSVLPVGREEFRADRDDFRVHGRSETNDE